MAIFGRGLIAAARAQGTERLAKGGALKFGVDERWEEQKEHREARRQALLDKQAERKVRKTPSWPRSWANFSTS